MAQEEITTAEIQPGKPVSTEILRKAKGNIEDHEERLTAAETGATTRPPIIFAVVGTLNTPFAVDGILHEPIRQALTITAVRVLVITAGSSGTFTADVERKRGGGAWTSVINAPIDVDYSAGDYAQESGVIAISDLEPGDLLRLNIDAAQAGMEDAYIYVENEVAA
jgi:hypothetical protein